RLAGLRERVAVDAGQARGGEGDRPVTESTEEPVPFRQPLLVQSRVELTDIDRADSQVGAVLDELQQLGARRLPIHGEVDESVGIEDVPAHSVLRRASRTSESSRR